MKQLQYAQRAPIITKKKNRIAPPKGPVCNRVENGAIGNLLDLAILAEKIVICNNTCSIVVHLKSEQVYFTCPTEVSFETMENALLKPYSKMYNEKLSVGRTDDTDMYVKPHETVLFRYAERLKGK